MSASMWFLFGGVCVLILGAPIALSWLRGAEHVSDDNRPGDEARIAEIEAASRPMTLQSEVEQLRREGLV